jgi:UDP-N-acetylmuramoyl-tripeptide--D-alanyl-D-alanine ligase
MCLSEATLLLNGELTIQDVAFAGISTDTRTITAGELFIALQGPHFDGHHFVTKARERGAAAALVSRFVPDTLPQIRVSDTRIALGRLSAAWRERFPGTVIALTGSNGKTTVKEMIVSILRVKHSVVATKGNLNNDIGVPLTLSRLTDESYAVIEMGANHQREIAYLCKLAQPDMALVTNAGSAHLEGFGGLDGVAKGKGEIFQGLGLQGTAIVNRDDHYAAYWTSIVGQRRLIDFGLSQSAQVRGHIIDAACNLLNIEFENQSVTFELPLPGEHNVRNALAAAAVAVAVGVALSDIKQGLLQVKPVGGRLQRFLGPNNCTVIHDAYNANPSSLAAALVTVSAAHDVKWLVLGDMAELGSQAEACHKEAGVQARKAGFQRCYGFGPLTRHTVAGFGQGGVHCETTETLIETLREALASVVNKPTLLIKGSRSMRMEQVVEALTNSPSPLASAGRNP